MQEFDKGREFVGILTDKPQASFDSITYFLFARVTLDLAHNLACQLAELGAVLIDIGGKAFGHVGGLAAVAAILLR
jgi:hypothetical protein